MSRPSKWGGLTTTAIRVPAHLAGTLLEMARLLATPKTEPTPPEDSASYVSPARLLTVSEGLDEKSYLIPPISLSASEKELIDALLDEFCTELSEREVSLLLAKLAPLILSELT